MEAFARRTCMTIAAASKVLETVYSYCHYRCWSYCCHFTDFHHVNALNVYVGVLQKCFFYQVIYPDKI